jgi:hypothetical protein
LGIVNVNVEFRTLSKVHGSLVFVKKKCGNEAAGDQLVYLVFRKRNVYYIVWGIDGIDEKNELFILKDEHPNFEK